MAMVWFPATEVAVGVSTTVKVKLIICKLLLTLVPSPESLTRKGVSTVNGMIFLSKPLLETLLNTIFRYNRNT
jgi:hypothetical protein